MTQRVKGKVILVSGAGSIGPGWGNGKASAVLYAREGAHVFAVDRSKDAAAETAEIIRAEGFQCVPWTADVTDSRAVEQMVQACVERFGRVDVLHNNVGIGGRGGPVETSEELWDRIMAVNVKSMFLTCKHVIPVMLAQGGGSIINVSSLSGVRALRPEVAYATSKAAVNGFTINVAMQYAAQNIRCNAILPGLMNTPLVAVTLAASVAEDEKAKIMRERDALSPTGTMGTGWDIAHAALFFASDDSKYVNGSIFLVDAGLNNRVG
jgi:NAD(P)-dependent dehydrogenase (short-subunit alcohol dehydrogenase family)